MPAKPIAPLMLAMFVTACAQQPSGGGSNATQSAEISHEQLAEERGESPADPLSVDETVQAPTDKPATIPLRTGAYVDTRVDCGNPANASFRVWDGQGLRGSATRDCRATVTSREGDLYRVSHDCEDTYNSERSTTQERWRIPDSTHITIVSEGGEQSFRRCAREDLPEFLADELAG